MLQAKGREKSQCQEDSIPGHFQWPTWNSPISQAQSYGIKASCKNGKICLSGKEGGLTIIIQEDLGQWFHEGVVLKGEAKKGGDGCG